MAVTPNTPDAPVVHRSTEALPEKSVYEIEVAGHTYEVEAESPEAAAKMHDAIWETLPTADKVKAGLRWAGNAVSSMTGMGQAGGDMVRDTEEHPYVTAASMAIPAVVKPLRGAVAPLVGPALTAVGETLEHPLVGGTVGALQGSGGNPVANPTGAMKGFVYGAIGGGLAGRLSKMLGRVLTPAEQAAVEKIKPNPNEGGRLNTSKTPRPSLEETLNQELQAREPIDSVSLPPSYPEGGTHTLPVSRTPPGRLREPSAPGPSLEQALQDALASGQAPTERVLAPSHPSGGGYTLPVANPNAGGRLIRPTSNPIQDALNQMAAPSQPQRVTTAPPVQAPPSATNVGGGLTEETLARMRAQGIDVDPSYTKTTGEVAKEARAIKVKADAEAKVKADAKAAADKAKADAKAAKTSAKTSAKPEPAATTPASGKAAPTGTTTTNEIDWRRVDAVPIDANKRAGIIEPGESRIGLSEQLAGLLKNPSENASEIEKIAKAIRQRIHISDKTTLKADRVRDGLAFSDALAESAKKPAPSKGARKPKGGS